MRLTPAASHGAQPRLSPDSAPFPWNSKRQKNRRRRRGGQVKSDETTSQKQHKSLNRNLAEPPAPSSRERVAKGAHHQNILFRRTIPPASTRHLKHHYAHFNVQKGDNNLYGTHTTLKTEELSRAKAQYGEG